MNTDSLLQPSDRTLIETILQKNSHKAVTTKNTLRFQNQTIADYAAPSYTSKRLDEIETFLDRQGTFAIPIIKQHSITIDGTIHPISIVTATDSADSHHGEMSSMIYLRDHIQTAGAYMELFLHDSKRYARVGIIAKDLLLSALHLLSTPAQLDRFTALISRGREVDQEGWPHISLYFNDLTADNPNGWRNKQDTFQMLAHLTLDATTRGFLSVDDLLPSHKQFLASIVPTLSSVSFPHYESSGSWEEVTAKRTSVIAIETALLHTLHTAFQQSNDYDFLRGETDRSAFTATVESLLRSGLIALGKALPNESPDYPHDSIKYRQADVALTYVLLYNLPPLLASTKTPITNAQIIMTERQIETLVLDQLETLIDPVTNGMFRYQGDSYQRVNFHTASVQTIIKDIKQQVTNEADTQHRTVDLDKKQQLRHERTPQGRQAAWTHPLGQIASWAALKRSHTHGDDQQHYDAIATRFLNRVLATITGEGTVTSSLTADSRYTIQQVPAFTLPECYITYDLDDVHIITASPHTPLNWSTAMAHQAIAIYRCATSEASFSR